jgi:hypothetical protein
MNLNQIKEAINSGKRVFWSTKAYEVICDKKGQWLIVCSLNGYTIGLTWRDGVTMNGKESEFFIGE